MLTTDTTHFPPASLRVTRFCRSGLTSVVNELKRDVDAEASDGLRAAEDLLELGIGQMSTRTATLSHPFQVQPVIGSEALRAGVERSTSEPEVMRFTAELPSGTPAAVRLVWFNMLSLVGGSEWVQPTAAADGTLRAEGAVRSGAGVVVAGIMPDTAGGRPGFALVAE